MKNIFETIKNFCTRTKDDENRIMLYTPEEIAQDKTREDVWMVPHLVKEGAPVAVICPGGAYAMVSHHNEGTPFAQALNNAGHNAFVLNYRTGDAARYPNPMLDLARAIMFIRKHAAALGVDAQKLSIWGSSAAGHLCAYFSARHSLFDGEYMGEKITVEPQATVLVYPVVSLFEETHEGTRDNLLGKNASEAERKDKSCDLIAGADYPPTFIMHCEDDGSVPVSNSKRLHAKLTSCGVKCNMHLYPTGGHGCGVAKGTSAEGWINTAIDFLNDTL